MKDQKIAIRPVISKINKNLAVSESEDFQNSTIRPIIKLQHSLLIAIVKQYAKKRKTTIKELSIAKFEDFLTHAFLKDINFKNYTKGVIIGQFTVLEYEKYLLNASDINKRLITIIIKRMLDSFKEFKT